MTGRVIDGPWQARRPEPTFDETERLKERAEVAAKASPDLLQWVRMPRADAERVAKNLGDIITEVARDLGLTEKAILHETFGPDRIAKRLRYVRLPSDQGLKTDEFATTFRDFHALAVNTLRMRIDARIEELEPTAEALLRLVEGTSRDLAENNMRRIDIDAARAVAELASTFIRRLEEAVPDLRNYFELLAKHQLFHMPFDQATWKTRFLETLSEREIGEYNIWTGGDWYWPIDLDTSHFVAHFTGHKRAGDGPANTVPPSFTYDGMWLIGDSDLNGIAGLLPRVRLGDIHRHGVACKSKPLWDKMVTDWNGDESPASVQDMIRGASANPTRVYLVVAPVLRDQSVSLSLGLIEENWPLGAGIIEKDGERYLLFGRPEVLDESQSVLWGPLMSWPDREVNGFLSLIPGESAKEQLGLRGLPGIEQLADELVYRPKDFDDLTDDFLRTRLIDIRPAIKIGSGFTPHPANTLGAALVSNLLYVQGPENALHMMIEDARSRVETLERHMAKWRRAFADAKAAFELGQAACDEQQTSLIRPVSDNLDAPSA